MNAKLFEFNNPNPKIGVCTLANCCHRFFSIENKYKDSHLIGEFKFDWLKPNHLKSQDCFNFLRRVRQHIIEDHEDDPNKFHFLLNKKLPYKRKVKSYVEQYELYMDRNEDSLSFDEEANAVFDDNIDEVEKEDENNDDGDNNSSTKEPSDSSSDSKSESDSSSDSEKSHE